MLLKAGWVASELPTEAPEVIELDIDETCDVGVPPGTCGSRRRSFTIPAIVRGDDGGMALAGPVVDRSALAAVQLAEGLVRLVVLAQVEQRRAALEIMQRRLPLRRRKVQDAQLPRRQRLRRSRGGARQPARVSSRVSSRVRGSRVSSSNYVSINSSMNRFTN